MRRGTDDSNTPGAAPVPDAATGEDPPADDGFARLASALPVQPPPSHKRLPGRSRPSFSDLAPVVPPSISKVRVDDPPRPVTLTSPPAPYDAGPALPSVIVASDPLPVWARGAPPSAVEGTPTARGSRRRGSGHSIATATVVLLLALSLLVFSGGLLFLLYSRRAP